MKMKQTKYIIILLLFITIFITGCFTYGDGQQVGYVSAVEKSFFWNKIYIKPTLESTQEDVYVISKSNKKLYDRAIDLMN